MLHGASNLCRNDVHEIFSFSVIKIKHGDKVGVSPNLICKSLPFSTGVQSSVYQYGPGESLLKAGRIFQSKLFSEVSSVILKRDKSTLCSTEEIDKNELSKTKASVITVKRSIKASSVRQKRA